MRAVGPRGGIYPETFELFCVELFVSRCVFLCGREGMRRRIEGWR